MQPLPHTASIEVSPGQARALANATRQLPQYEMKDLYSFDLQQEIHDIVRRGAGAAFDDLVDAIRGRLGTPPHTALVRNLDFDSNHGLFVALNRAHGDLISSPYQPPRAQLVHYIQPATDISSLRGTVTESERLHTDAADWPQPAEIISMVCIRPDGGGGGRTRLLTVGGFRADVEAEFGTNAISRFETECVPWKLAEYHGAGVCWQPVLSNGSLRWRRYTIDAALALPEISLAPDMVELLDAVDRAIADSPSTIEFLMAAGEFLITDNRRTLHSRTPLCSNYQSSGRLMIRSWVSNRSGHS